MSARVLSLVMFGLLVAACGDDDVVLAPPPPPPPPAAPRIDAIAIPTFPPLGRDGRVAVRISDDGDLARVTASFRDVTVRPLFGSAGEVTFTGAELGEGQGTLALVACDRGGMCRSRHVDDLIVDMTPPEVALERVVVSPLRDGVDGQVAVWARDAWVLGRVEIRFAGQVFGKEFEKAYPSTVGEAWDVSRVAFPASSFPEGRGKATLSASDAAGNSTATTVDLWIDGTPPTAAILTPAEGATVGAAFTVTATATDGGEPATIDVFVGGARIVVDGLSGTPIVVDGATLPPGTTEIRVVARDAAGNESLPALRHVVVP